MSENVIPFSAAMQVVLPVDSVVIKMLEDLLVKARAGDINGIAFVTLQIDGAGSVVSVGTGWGGQGVHQAVQTTVGGVAHLQYRLIAERLEGPA